MAQFPNIACIVIFYYYFFPHRCSSLIGYRSGQSQTVTLGSGCEYRGTIAHEIMHLLGFYHEQTRTDRDQYIDVNKDNIIPGMYIHSLTLCCFSKRCACKGREEGRWEGRGPRKSSHLVGIQSSRKVY